MNDGINEQRIPANLSIICPGRRRNKKTSPSTILVDGIFDNATGRVPACLTDQIPSGAILLIAEHDDMSRYDAESLAYLFLNIGYTTLVNGDRRKAFIPWDVATVRHKVRSTGLEEC